MLDGGQSEWMLLENLDLTIHGDEVAWLHLELSDGVLTSHATFPMTLTADEVCDFDSNDVCDAADIDLLFASGDVSEGVPVPPGDVAFDINGDGIIDNGDADQWLAAAASENGFAGPFPRGDANLDGTVDAADLNALALNWRGSDAVWSGGDFTGDGNVTAEDLNELALKWRSSLPLASRTETIPEPSTGLLASFGMLAVLVLRQQMHHADSCFTPIR